MKLKAALDKYGTLYRCYVPNCSFSTDQKGMDIGITSLHLKYVHKTESGFHNFKKIKTESSSLKKSTQKEMTLKAALDKYGALFRCFSKDCSYHTTKKGMLYGKAAVHMKRVHDVTAAKMREARGFYKWHKIETSSISDDFYKALNNIKIE